MNDQSSGPPGVLPDHEIERLGIVHPFLWGEKRSGIISYGATAYGYDVRASHEPFRVFSNVRHPGRLVDPKRISSESFEEVAPTTDETGSWVAIPPNSYALCSSLEYLRIPRDVIAFCVGKSTLARCFSGETRVLLANGKSPTFRQMAENPQVPRWGFGVLPKTGTYTLSHITAPRWIGRESLLRVTLDDGSVIDCTPDHGFLRHGGFYTEAADLRPGDGLVPLYTRRFRGRQCVWLPRAGRWIPAYWLADHWNLRHGVYDYSDGNWHRHHKDGNIRNDNPTNIDRMDASDHIRLHNSEYYGEGFDAARHSRAISDAIQERMGDPRWKEVFRKNQRAKAKKFRESPEMEEARRRWAESIRAAWSQDEERKESARERMREYNKTVSSEERASRWSEERRRKQAEVMRRVNKKRGRGNHKVVSVKSLRGKHDVFCLTSEDTGNFALASGVIVRNCGLIVNVTPLEPEWHGQVTIEISNSSPLPAKVYCGEGVMQVNFHRVSLLCRTSYGDKGGIYQGQTGITLARVVQE